MKKTSIKTNKTATRKRASKKKFLTFFTPKNLQDIFEQRISRKDCSGIDGVHAHDLPDDSFEIINRKVSAGTYHFTPYAEIQAPKGRGKLPRIIALATVRDQIVLSALKDYLHKVFPDAVNHKLPNSHIFELNKEIQNAKTKKRSYGFVHTDIAGFYDNIDREKLMNCIRSTINIPEALKLIYRAIANPIVPRNSRRNQRFHYFTPKGVPQGLAISNILAGIYMLKFDKSIESISTCFIRYVDDSIILCPTSEIPKIFERLHFEVSKLGLELNEEKTKIGVLNKDSFVFLGYKLKTDGRISVRDSSVHRKISSLAANISSADHKKEGFLKLHSIGQETYTQVLIEDMNEQITGALSDGKRYGWLFYFSQINDMGLLHRLDRIVEKLCKRCYTFSKKKPEGVKSFVTAFREIHKLSSDVDSYIPSYDDWNNRQKIDFLHNRGVLIEEKPYRPEEIDRLFKINIRKRLLSLEKDVRNMS